MKKIVWIGLVLLAAAAVCFFSLLGMYNNGDIGMTQSAMEEEVENSNLDLVDRRVTQDIGNSMAVFLQYEADKSDFDSKVYVKRDNTMGWFFRHGYGSMTVHERYVAKIEEEGHREYVLLSMNPMGVSRIEIDKGDSVETVEISEGEPFALIMDQGWDVTLYDAAGGIVEPVDYK